MKKIKILSALLAITLSSKAQPYGQNTYNHVGAFLSSGTIIPVAGTQGFLMGGYRLTSPAGAPNFYVDRTDLGGSLSITSTFTFFSEYAIQGNISCSGLTPATDCAGVSVIPENLAGGPDYALAGAFSGGVFFSMLNATGAPYSQVLFPFPPGSTLPTKPTIIASNIPNEYYICGAYVQPSIPTALRMYILKVNNAGAVLASMIHHIATGIVFDPKDMLLSPYNPNELVVVGRAFNNLGSAGFINQGFFATFDANVLNNTSCQLWGQVPFTNPLQDDFFNTITVSNTFGGSYVIGGYSNASANTCWMLNVNQNGTASNWNNHYQTNLGGNRGITDVIERYSNWWGINTYYGVVDNNTNPNWLTVIKLDDVGNFFHVFATGENSEFEYGTQTNAPMSGVAITQLDNGANNDQGIHVYGNNSGAFGGASLLIEGAFNGPEGCFGSIMTQGIGTTPGPNNTFWVGVVNLVGLSPCSTFNLVQSSPAVAWLNLCGSSTLPMGGNLLKEAVTTGISKNSEASEGLGIYPNPTNDKLQLSFYNANDSKISIQLFNNLGQLVSNVNVPANLNSGEQTLEFNLSTLNIESGIYFIKASINGVEYKEKIVYNKQ